MTVYVSWNGATGRRLLEGVRRRQPTDAQARRHRAQSGFETAITARARAYVSVQALGLRAIRWEQTDGRAGSCTAPAAEAQPKPKPTTHAKPPTKKIAAIRANRVLPRVYGILITIPAACAGGSDPRPFPFIATPCPSCWWTGSWSRSLTSSLSG